MNQPALLQDAQHFLDVLLSVLLGGRERQLERGALHVVDEDVQVVGIDQRVLGRGIEEIRGIADNELIERRAAGDEHGRRPTAPSSRTSGSLPRGGDRPGVTGHDTDVERADVDAELQRVGRDDRAHAPLAQPFFNLAAALRQVTTAIAPNLILRAWLAAEIVLQVCRQDLGRQATLGEHDQL